MERNAALKKSGLAADQADDSLRRLLDSGQALALDSHLISAAAWQTMSARVKRDVEAFHRRFPLRPGISKEELKNRLGLPLKVFNAAVAEWAKTGQLADRGAFLADASFEVQFSPELQRKLDSAMAALRQKPFAPPSESELGLSPEELALLLGQGKATRVSDNVLFETGAYQQMIDRTVEHVGKQSKITLAEFRDLFDTSRKYAQAFLEHLDERRITRRVGDERVLGAAARRA